ncbi:hypothetical protein CkaCkLH20_09334 [Colletotrichum karsti]|uniref:AB hydrolase-1 domain-containing protein n=1 Tax=Colletotrichum karsti TaxID=1095194 RepID=A0A9P6I385_9PEZI|nr:uncharacterized protein CkaCkLH20_09334 [Colletotrichum karsti]KAF9873171.1 hypothetical protein CkaCkLH20_09334 [Colletotrichum karsti]
MPASMVPEQPSEGFVHNGHVKIHYRAGGHGPLLLLLHGFPDNSNTWNKQMEHFAKRHTVVCPTLRGYPPSDIPEVEEPSYNLVKILGDVIAILDYFNAEKAVIGGHDFGGALIQLVALFHPERVEGLIIINSPILPRFYDLVNHDKDQQAQSAYTIPFIQHQPGNDKNTDFLVQTIRDPAYRDEVRQYVNESPIEGMFAYYKYNYPSPPYDQAVNTSTMLYQVPTLIIWGLDDGAFSLKMLDGIPNHFKESVRLVTLPGVGHWAFREQPDRVNEEISSWLISLSSIETSSA